MTMKDYKQNGSVYEITLDNDKKVKVATAWVEKTIEALGTDLEDVLLMWLEDNEYIINEEQQELTDKSKANGSAKVNATDKAKRKTPKERVQKENPEKEMIIAKLAEMLPNIAINVEIENKSKLITFKIGDNDYKLDLIQKRKPKNEEK